MGRKGETGGTVRGAPKEFKPTPGVEAVLVITGSRVEFDHFVQNQGRGINPAFFIFVQSLSDIRHKYNHEIIHVGNWHRNEVTDSKLWADLIEDSRDDKRQEKDQYNRAVIR